MTAIIVTFNPSIPAFSDVLHAHSKTGVSDIVIIDNNSGNYPDIVQAVSSLALNFKLVRLRHNVGIGAAQNIGIDHAIKSRSSHIMLFDQDSSPAPEMAYTLLCGEAELIAAGVRVGAIGPVFHDPRSDCYSPMMKIAGPLLLKMKPRLGSAPVKVSFIIASGSLIRLDVLDLVGAMNEDFFMDCVDIEWCLRAGAQGFGIFVSSHAVMSHTIGDYRTRSLGREISIHSPLRRYYMARNWILLARLPWVPLGLKIRELFCLFTRVPIFLCSVRFDRSYVKSMAKGILHGFLGQGGPFK